MKQGTGTSGRAPNSYALGRKAEWQLIVHHVVHHNPLAGWQVATLLKGTFSSA